MIELLKHHHAIGAGLLDDLVVEPDLALGRRHVAADRLQQCRFAAARWSEHDVAIGLVDLEVDPIGRGDEMILGLVLQRHAADFEQRLRGRWRRHIVCVFVVHHPIEQAIALSLNGFNPAKLE